MPSCSILSLTESPGSPEHLSEIRLGANLAAGLSQCLRPDLINTAGFPCRHIPIKCIHLSSELNNGRSWGFSKLRTTIIFTTYIYFKDQGNKATLVEKRQ